ncbi:hypothetical protein GCM10008905_04240 [Clostridium malenominatum]|uniref:Lipoprotein n=1 Tax=Clostridium malenominatum TaxID=1539 RepID=A0ABN1INF5_9CLOT
MSRGRRKGSGSGLLILILIVLQFSCNRPHHGGEHGQCIDNSILFIIALYFLACCGNIDLCCGC